MDYHVYIISLSKREEVETKFVFFSKKQRLVDDHAYSFYKSCIDCNRIHHLSEISFSIYYSGIYSFDELISNNFHSNKGILIDIDTIILHPPK